MRQGGGRERHHTTGTPPHRQDPIEIPRAALCDTVADLDQVGAAVDAHCDPDTRALFDEVLCSLHARLFGHLPEGEAGGATC